MAKIINHWDYLECEFRISHFSVFAKAIRNAEKTGKTDWTDEELLNLFVALRHPREGQCGATLDTPVSNSVDNEASL